MGEVYRARDTRLDRIVAIKILPPHIAGDLQFRERFNREARMISQLTHPHICTLHDIGEHDHTAFLVMEHLEGETLADRLQKGPLPIEQALKHAIEIAAALEAAYRHGIVHRDLKPGNIMLPKSGVKLLDFGLAKVGPAAVASGGVTADMPTIAPLTAKGTILGTFQYMAPEQLEGREADARSDIWAFGCVLYEMIAGRRAFDGQTPVSVIGAILERDPAPLTELQPKTPPALAKLIRTCLAKDPEDRFQNPHDLRLQLQWILESGPVVGAPGASVPRGARRLYFGWAASVIAAVALTAAASSWWRKPAAGVTPVVSRFVYVLPDGQDFTRGGRHLLALSPDGSKLAYVANQQIYLRQMNALEAQPIRGTNEDPAEPIFSPDGTWIAYFATAPSVGAAGGGVTLKKVPTGGGPPVTLAKLADLPFGASWRAGMILFGMNVEGAYGIQAVAEGGGTPRMLATVDGRKERAGQPRMLDDGKHLLFVVAAAGRGDYQIVVQHIAGGERQVVVADATDPHFLPTGHLAYFQNGTLLAAPFDPKRLTLSGEPVVIAEGVGDAIFNSFAGQYAIAANVLTFQPAVDDTLRRLLWVDRQGREIPIATKPRAYIYARVSPDGAKIAISSEDEERDIWVFDISKETLTRVTFGPADDRNPVWSIDGRQLLYRSGGDPWITNDAGDIFRKAVDGTGTTEALTQNLTGGMPQFAGQDGRSVVFRRMTSTGFDLYVLPLDPRGEPRALLANPRYHEFNAVLSPDGRWLAYESDESARLEIYVRPFPNTDGGRWQISSDGGRWPLWARSGRELLYVTSGNRLAVVTTVGTPNFSFSAAEMLFDVTPYLLGVGGSRTVSRPFDISPDGQRLVMSRSVNSATTKRPSIVIVTNWFEELRARVR